MFTKRKCPSHVQKTVATQMSDLGKWVNGGEKKKRGEIGRTL